MKSLFTLSILTLSCLFANGSSNKERLLDVNSQWKNTAIKSINYVDEPDNIRFHLKNVVAYLSNKDYNLTNTQLINRKRVLDILKIYAFKVQYPINTIASYQTPVFIDNFNNYCAVGYLLKETGYNDLAITISRTDNLIYLSDASKQFPQIKKWAEEFGFTTGELALIQPSYPAESDFNLLKKGVIGSVNSIVSLKINSTERMVIAGDFTNNPGEDVFKNIAYWDNSNWIGIINNLGGEIKKAAVIENSLFALGNFKENNKSFSLARLDKTIWKHYYEINGEVKNIRWINNQFLVCGNFTLNGTPNVQLASFKEGEGWVVLLKNLNGILNDIILDYIHNQYYAGGKFADVNSNLMTISSDFKISSKIGNSPINGFSRFRNSIFLLSGDSLPQTNSIRKINISKSEIEEIKCSSDLVIEGAMQDIIHVSEDELYFVGSFRANVWNTLGSNIARLKFNKGDNKYDVDGLYFKIYSPQDPAIINSATLFGGNLIVGGKFTKLGGEQINSIVEINLVKKDYIASEKIPRNPDYIEVYPNPTQGVLYLNSTRDIQTISITDMTGKLLRTFQTNEIQNNTVDICELPMGTFIINTILNDGNIVREKIIKIQNN